MLNTLPFWHDPKQFLQSYFWGCNQGHELSLRCKQQLDQVRPDEFDSQAAEKKITESLLDCYVHTKVCSRCESMEKLACQRGYELIQERDSAYDAALKLGVERRRISIDSIDTISDAEMQAVFNKDFAQQQFLFHMGSCEICTSKRPIGRYNFSVWNIEIARSQKSE